ncbi:MAG: hypothetical protein GX459_12810 [Bacteroidales bacterium]|nr:hypothetical protein [Bacteroidales bacterium]
MEIQNPIIQVNRRMRYEIPDGFLSAFQKLPYGVVHRVRRKIMSDCSWSYQHFVLKMKGKSTFTGLEKKYLEDLFATYGINAWSGEKL